MSYKIRSLFRSNRAFFRSSMASGIAGLFAGGSVVASALETNHNPSAVVAGLSTIAAASVVALADWVVRRKQLREHDQKFQREHRTTRRLVRKAVSPRGDANPDGKEEKV